MIIDSGNYGILHVPMALLIHRWQFQHRVGILHATVTIGLFHAPMGLLRFRWQRNGMSQEAPCSPPRQFWRQAGMILL